MATHPMAMGSLLLLLLHVALCVETARLVPDTIFWDGDLLLQVRELARQQEPPEWVSLPQTELLRQADLRVSLPAGLRHGVGAGPWSPLNKSMTPPSGDKRDYYTISGYAWPCTTTCEQAAATLGASFTSEDCADWTTKSFGSCDASTGKPWVMHDGFLNPGNLEDLNILIVTADTIEILALAWWFAPAAGDPDEYAKAAMTVLRTYFLQNETALRPELRYGGAIPGYYDEGTYGALIAPTFRFGTRLADSVAVLRAAGSQIWTAQDEDAWVSWSSRWMSWLQESTPAKHELKHSVGNHATWLYAHKLAMAMNSGDTDMAAELVGMIRDALPGSLVHQIEPNGAMPIEIARPTGATYTRMNLDALFTLGVVAERVCSATTCKPGWSWDWTQPEPQVTGWFNYSDTISTCTHLRNLASPTSIDHCLEDCLAGSDGCTAVNARHKWGSLMDCSMKRCDRSDKYLEDAPIDEYNNVMSAYVWATTPDPGSGSVLRALNFVLPYALGQKDWKEDYPHTLSKDASLSWTGIAPQLRIAAAVFDNSTYESMISDLEPDFGDVWPHDKFNLLFPMAGIHLVVATATTTPTADPPASTTPGPRPTPAPTPAPSPTPTPLWVDAASPCSGGLALAAVAAGLVSVVQL